MPDTPYGQFLDRVPDGFLLFDEQGCLLDANAHACASLGHHKAAMLGLGIMDVWPDADGLRRGPWQDMAVDSQAHLCGRLIRRDGTSFPPSSISIASRCRAGGFSSPPGTSSASAPARTSR